MSMAIIGVAGTVIGAGVGLYGASQAGQTPPPRNINAELNAIPYDTFREHARDLTEDQLQIGQEFSDRNLANFTPYLNATLGAQGEEIGLAGQNISNFARQERTLTTRQRRSDLADLTGLGPGMQAAYASASPGYAALLAEIGRPRREDSPLLGSLNAEALGTRRSALGDEMERQALEEVSAGRGLTAEESRMATQGARQAWADRGLALSNPAVGSEILARDQYASARLRDRLAMGAGVEAAVGGEDAQNRGFRTNVEGLNENAAQADRGFLLNAAQATMAPVDQMMARRMNTSIYQPILGAMGMAPSAALPAQVMSMSPTIFQGAQALSPLLGYASDLNSSNFNSAAAGMINSANAYTSLGGGLLSAGGRLAGGGMGGGGHA